MSLQRNACHPTAALELTLWGSFLPRLACNGGSLGAPYQGSNTRGAAELWLKVTPSECSLCSLVRSPNIYEAPIVGPGLGPRDSAEKQNKAKKQLSG